MAKVKLILNWCIPMVLITVALVTAAVAQTGSITIWPDQLIPMIPASSYQQSISFVSNGSFNVPITIPVGARIVRMIYYHIGEVEPASTKFTVRTVKLGNASEVIGSENSTDATGAIIRVSVPITGDPSIKTGYRYYIRVDSDNENSKFLGARIVYQE